MRVEAENYRTACVIDETGYLIGVVRYLKRLPKLKPGQQFVTDPAAVKAAFEHARWDARKKEWKRSPHRYYVVRPNHQFAYARNWWPNRIPTLPEGYYAVTVEPPKLRGRKPLWNDESGQWEFPRRVGIVSADGVLLSIELESPRSDMPDAVIPEDCTRIDDCNWPCDIKGNPISIGARREKNGDWQPAKKVRRDG